MTRARIEATSPTKGSSKAIEVQTEAVGLAPAELKEELTRTLEQYRSTQQ